MKVIIAGVLLGVLGGAAFALGGMSPDQSFMYGIGAFAGGVMGGAIEHWRRERGR